MADRRNFLFKLGLMAGAFSASSLFNELHAAEMEGAESLVEDDTPLDAATNEDYWSVIQQAYTVNPSIINLNNGGVSPAPRVVQEALDRYNKFANEAPSYYMWRVLDLGREPLREKLALLAGCDKNEIAINRNATEGLTTIIHGLPLNRGDEVIGARQDYPCAIHAYRQRALRDKIKYTQVSFDFPVENDEEIVRAYEEAITPKTKLLHITHVINWVGQVMPVKKLCKMAHDKGIEVIVDGAHSFGLLDFKIPDLGCDYFGTSLHKFLSAPVGTGMMWIRKENIAKIWPLVCADKPTSGNIRKFEELGTRSFPIEQAIGEAINFHTAIGSKRKEERIRYLKNYWANKVKDVPGVRLHTSLKDAYSCAIAGVSVNGMTPQQLDSAFFSDYKIHTVAIFVENINCVRVTPHVYTRLDDLDKLVRAITEIAGRKRVK